MATHSNRSSILKALSLVLVFLALTNVVGESVQGSTTKTKHRRLSKPISSSLMSSQASTTKWKNQRGSTMVLINDGKGNLTGEYTTAVGCEDVKGKPQKLFGTTNGSAISFTVNWGVVCKSIASWTGQMESPDKISTLWLLSVSSSDPAKDFKANYAGSDVFTRTP